MRGLPIEDGDKREFKGISFDASSFGTWFRRIPFQVKHDYESMRSEIKLSPPEKIEIEIADFGIITINSTSNITKEENSAHIIPVANFRVEFHENKSLNEVVSYCTRLNSLFGFLIGCPMKPPIYKTWTSRTYNSNGILRHHEGTLEIGGTKWINKMHLRPMDCIHVDGWGGADLKTVLEKFLSDSDGFMNRFYAIEHSRFFTRDLNSRFAVLMPAFEEFVKRRFASKEEVEFAQQEKEFFGWVELSKNDALIQFSKKHIQVVKRKSASLPMLIERSIEELNGLGFCFPTSLAKSINNRRGAVFHSVPQMNKHDIYKYYSEVRALNGLLTLHTLGDLGIEVSYLAQHHQALSHFNEYLHKRTPLASQTAQSSPCFSGANNAALMKHEDWYGPL